MRYHNWCGGEYSLNASNKRQMEHKIAPELGLIWVAFGAMSN
jgi:hypothetical protein